MIDVLTETIISKSQACNEPALRNSQTGERCHPSQFYRFVQIGARAANGDRVKLETIRTPSGLKTSREAVARFIAALTNPDAPVASISPTVRRKRADAAKQELAAAGFAMA